MKKKTSISSLFLMGTWLLFVLPNAGADQFVLFDQVFTFAEKDAIPTKSHLHVNAAQFGNDTPKDWTSPIDYRNGTVHMRIEVLEKPPGGAPTFWSICYLPNKGRDNKYGCLGTPKYTKPGVYEKIQDMNTFWKNDSIIWTDGIKRMSLVIKGPKINGKAHAHVQPDLKKYFPTKIRVTLTQVSKGDKYDPQKSSKEVR